MMLGPVHVLSCVTGINRKNSVQCGVWRRINVTGTDANTSAARGGGYKVYLTQMSSEEYTAPPIHTMPHALPTLGKATSSIYIRRTNGSTCTRDGSQVPLMGPG